MGNKGISGTSDQEVASIENQLGLLRHELAGIDTRRIHETESIRVLSEEITGLARKALHDSKSLDSQVALNRKLETAQQQLTNLNNVETEIRYDIEIYEKKLIKTVRRDALQELSNARHLIEATESRINQAIQHLAVLVGDFYRKTCDVFTTAHRKFDEADTKREREGSIREVILTGVRAEIAAAFSSQELTLVDDTERVVFRHRIEELLNALVKKLEVKTHGTDVVPGRSRFRCTTNIRSLFGSDFRADELVSLPIDDPEVVKLMKLGAIVKLNDSEVFS